MNDNRYFLDTNILVRYDINDLPESPLIYQAITSLIDQQAVFWISPQVMREYCRTLTYPTFPTPYTMPQAVARLRKLIIWINIADETRAVSLGLLTLLENVPIAGKQVHDANIVATMQSLDITQLITLNIDDFKRFVPRILLLAPKDIIPS